MTSLLNRIISLNIELEGALRVAANRPSVEALENAKRKFAEISALFAMLDPQAFVESINENKTEIKIQEAEGNEEEPLVEPDLPRGIEVISEIRDIYNEKTENNQHPTDRIEQTSPRRLHGDFRKSFTLNDLYLFRRELFGNNEEEFNATLSLIGSMDSFDEVEEYIYEDLRWDKSAPNVKSFMDVAKRFFE